MICYRDMTFCPFFGDCVKADACPRPMTAEIIIAADRMGLPISRFTEKPDCHEPIEDPIDGDAR